MKYLLIMIAVSMSVSMMAFAAEDGGAKDAKKDTTVANPDCPKVDASKTGTKDAAGKDAGAKAEGEKTEKTVK
jgi:hypothetical protein